MQTQLVPLGCWIYVCSVRKRRWAKTSLDNLELHICKNAHPQSQKISSFWLPQCVARDSQQEHQQPFCLAIECADGVSDVLVADHADDFSAIMQAINLRGRTFFSEPSGGYVHHRHNFMLLESWDLCWAVIEEQFLSLWKNKSEFEAAARSSSVGGMGGEVRPLLVLPLLCATVIQCTDNVTISIDLHQGGAVVGTHYLYLGTPASCTSWMAGFLKAVGYDRTADTTDGSSFSTQLITTLDLSFPKPSELVKTPEPGSLALAAGEPVLPKADKTRPDMVYGSAEQLAATAVPPLPDKEAATWVPLDSSELSKISAALGNPLEAIGSRISASLSWFKSNAMFDARADAAAGVAGAVNSARVTGAAPDTEAAPSSAAESSASTQRSGPASHSIQTAQSLRHRQPTSANGEAEQIAFAAVQPEALPLDSPPAASNGGLLSSLPLPECLSPAHFLHHAWYLCCVEYFNCCTLSSLLCFNALTSVFSPRQGWAAVASAETITLRSCTRAPHVMPYRTSQFMLHIKKGTIKLYCWSLPDGAGAQR